MPERRPRPQNRAGTPPGTEGGTHRRRTAKTPPQPEPIAQPEPEPELEPSDRVVLTSPAGTCVTVPTRMADNLRRQGWN